MKTIIKTIILAAASLFAAMSCRKETVGDSAGNVADGVRVISVQFDNSTKAVFGSDGLTPKFVNNDRIRVSNSEKSEECVITVSGASASFTTTLSGELTAIYPAAAADYTGSGPISSQAFKVLATQTGKVEDAIIAKAEIAAESSSATFNGVTALFEIAPPSTAKKITVTSLKKVESGSRTGTAADINTDDTEKTVITVGDDIADLPDTIYVALVPGVNLTDLSFDAGEAVGLKGIPASKLGTTYTDATAPNVKYTIGSTNWHPYVTIGDKKWATMNIGANSSTEAGTYFAWGSVEKVYTGLSSNTFTFQTNNPNTTRYTGTWTPGSGFADCNTPYYNGSAYTKYTGSDGKTVLELADDAAYANWGGPWRMPTGGTVSNADFTALTNAAIESYSSGSVKYTQTITTSGAPSSQGVYYYKVSGETVGVYFVDSSLKKLFFPAAGNVNYGTSLSGAGVDARYWSSSLYSSPSIAYGLLCRDRNVYPQDYSARYFARPVRPVSD